MPNYSVFQANPEELKALIFGSDGTTARPLAVNASAELLVGGATVTGGTLDAVSAATIAGGTLDAVSAATIAGGTLDAVSAATIAGGTLDAVSAATIAGGTLDAVSAATIAGGTLDAVSAATIAGGTLDSVTSISQRSFLEIANTDVATGDTLTALPAVTTAVLGHYSYFIYNAGANDAVAQVEISADGTHWYTDIPSTTVASGSVAVLVPTRFLKYTRLAYASAVVGAATTIDVYFNAQGT
ncbi:MULTISPECIES: DUF6385 domain-containing protein [Hydrogenibacillus]|uniref:DUF6385 domain-containing protein n=1 Tax=Hydrogenibacillus schlegelii TaxID=1484 RepID=A0A179IQF0_HYDSH|nr:MULTISPECIES: DUF6385 domain-containing protein [Hydrogenibacillus]OAR04898.1 hypothetical protein SA87_09860 [Hydrogenibacillus schlegelii]QZA32541.1 hypothetical protein K2M58_09620 [Hydrogenibacillus sp. N12]